jgi:GntR family transcriptional repressor for pyruvate dehydrogenase complex
VDATLEGLKALIVGLQPDTQGLARLPTERELARTLDVQRSTLRERLAALEALGLIRRTQGSGTYLSLPDSTFVQFYFELALKLGYFSAEQLGQARELIEREVARTAATHATAADLQALEAAYAQLEAATSVEAGDTADYAFHLALCRAAHNPVIGLLMDGLASVLFQALQQRRRVLRAVPGAAARTNATHRPLLDAIHARDPERALAAMDEHFRAWDREARLIDNSA